jgi:hypothetical protein
MDQPVVDDVATRPGDGDITVELSVRLISPLTGEPIDAPPVPLRWLRGVSPGTLGGVDGLTVTVGNVVLGYDVDGLSR